MRYNINYKGRREKALAAIGRKVAEAIDIEENVITFVQRK
jgi:hypothetical protein